MNGTDHDEPAEDDVVSDPGKDDSDDWTDEGGATPDGPATDVDEE